METLSIRVDDIEIGERHRALSGDAVQRLAGSIKEIGLKSPISIRIADDVMIDGKPCDGVPILVAGAHRLAAAKSLGWSHIDCIEESNDPIAAELWEIAENLHRCDLSKEQRDEHIRRYAELLTSRETARTDCPTSLTDGRKAGPQHKPGIATQIAEETGLSQRTIRRALNPQPKPPRPQLVEVVDAYDAIAAQADAIVRAWNRAGPEARALAMEQIEGVVFDNTRAA